MHSVLCTRIAGFTVFELHTTHRPAQCPKFLWAMTFLWEITFVYLRRYKLRWCGKTDRQTHSCRLLLGLGLIIILLVALKPDPMIRWRSGWTFCFAGILIFIKSLVCCVRLQTNKQKQKQTTKQNKNNRHYSVILKYLPSQVWIFKN